MATRVAIIGGGISGVAAAHVLQKNGFEPVIFEKGSEPGGVWAHAYPGVRLQNTLSHYHLSDFPWPSRPDLHPTGAQILDYWKRAVAHFRLDVRLQHEIIALEEQPDGWVVRCRHGDNVSVESFAYVIIATGQYTDGKQRPCFPGENEFDGEVLTERDIKSLDVFDRQRVVIMGFGKSAVDMATAAATRAISVHQVFRTPRWMIPQRILGVHFTFALFNRFGTVMMPGWAHPTAAERWLHRRLGVVVRSFWRTIASVFAMQVRGHAPTSDIAAQQRLAAVVPDHPLTPDLRSAAALAPEQYYEHVAAGRIQPRRGEIAAFDDAGVVLKDGSSIPCDIAVICAGSKKPAFPFLPEHYRGMLEREEDGAQLYRHLVHPEIPRLGFAGFNHGYMHVPAVEVGTLWLCALWRGELELPAAAEMHDTIEYVRAWKREHIHFEPSRSCAINTRFQQYIDILLCDLGVSPYRKLPNVAAEVFGRYGAGDYRKVGEEYARAAVKRRGKPRRPIAVHT